ncbi:hypothetical protein BDZ97DRAFT_88776 [Flammula alnicola]|nr:hypothetical protein BDZ97DRAFT_88776 [Flammula alnicola]
MSHSIPYELHELILRYLIDDCSTLKSCSFVCHGFASISQKFLFERVSVPFSEEGQVQIVPERFLDLVTISPHISELIQSMSVIDNYEAIGRSALYKDAILPACLPLLSNLKTFRLERRSWTINWPCMSSMSTNALVNTFQSQSLVSLTLYRVLELPLAVVEGCVALKELSLEYVTFAMVDMLESSERRWELPRREKRNKLKTLQLAFSRPSLRFFSAWITSATCNFDLSNLRRLSVSMTVENYDHRDLGKILQASANTLEEFCFGLIFQDDSLNPDAAVATPIHIGILSHLRVLRLCLERTWRRFGHVHPNFHLWTFKILGQLISSDSIEEISIKSIVLCNREGRVNFSMSAWTLLDTLLATQVPSLRKVTFFFLKYEAEIYPEIQSDIGSTFSALGARGILNVEKAHVNLGFSESGFPHGIDNFM